MKGNLFIDGRDVMADYGIVVTQGSFNQLIAFPNMKKIESIDWYEEDGIDPDLSSPQLSAKDIDIHFLALYNYRVPEFLEFLSIKPYREYYFTDIDQRYTLRMTSQSALKLYSGSESFTLRFSDDKVERSYSNKTLAPTQNTITGYSIDSKDFSIYGVMVLEGTKAEIEKIPNVKPNILLNYNYLPGVVYKGSSVRYKSKEVTVKCLMSAATLSDFWSQYNALIEVLKKPALRKLTVDETSTDYDCYYSKCSTDRLILNNDGIYWAFGLTFIFTSPKFDNVLVLAVNNNQILTLKDGRAINLRLINP